MMVESVGYQTDGVSGGVQWRCSGDGYAAAAACGNDDTTVEAMNMGEMLAFKLYSDCCF